MILYSSFVQNYIFLFLSCIFVVQEKDFYTFLARMQWEKKYFCVIALIRIIGCSHVHIPRIPSKSSNPRGSFFDNETISLLVFFPFRSLVPVVCRNASYQEASLHRLYHHQHHQPLGAILDTNHFIL